MQHFGETVKQRDGSTNVSIPCPFAEPGGVFCLLKCQGEPLRKIDVSQKVDATKEFAYSPSTGLDGEPVQIFSNLESL